MDEAKVEIIDLERRIELKRGPFKARSVVALACLAIPVTSFWMDDKEGWLLPPPAPSPSQSSILLRGHFSKANAL